MKFMIFLIKIKTHTADRRQRGVGAGGGDVLFIQKDFGAKDSLSKEANSR